MAHTSCTPCTLVPTYTPPTPKTNLSQQYVAHTSCTPCTQSVTFSQFGSHRWRYPVGLQPHVSSQTAQGRVSITASMQHGTFLAKVTWLVKRKSVYYRLIDSLICDARICSHTNYCLTFAVYYGLADRLTCIPSKSNEPSVLALRNRHHSTLSPQKSQVKGKVRLGRDHEDPEGE